MYFLLTLFQLPVACKKGSTAPGLDCCVWKASLIVQIKATRAGEVLFANYRPLCRNPLNPLTLWSMNILNAQYHREGAAVAWKFPWYTVTLAREFGMLRMCILCVHSVPELHNMHAIMRALYPCVTKVSHTHFRIYAMILFMH